MALLIEPDEPAITLLIEPEKPAITLLIEPEKLYISLSNEPRKPCITLLIVKFSPDAYATDRNLQIMSGNLATNLKECIWS